MAQEKKKKPGARQKPQRIPAASARSDSPAPEVDAGPSAVPVAALCGSAGGLDALRGFFSAMPAHSGIAFVLIPHLDPTHKSFMAELVGRHTHMPVVEAREGMAVAADRVYVIPPNKYMTFAHGVLYLTGPVERGGLQTSMDLFLRSLADELQEKAICIILSGTGAHGTLGLKAVKAAGGLAIVQDPQTAEYPDMPRNAVATNLADYVVWGQGT